MAHFRVNLELSCIFVDVFRGFNSEKDVQRIICGKRAFLGTEKINFFFPRSLNPPPSHSTNSNEYQLHWIFRIFLVIYFYYI